MGRRGHIVALWAALGLMGCFDKLPEPLACAGSADCLTGESCVGGTCVRALVEEDMDAPDMLAPDMSGADMSGQDMTSPDMGVPDMDAPDMREPDMEIGPTIITIQFQDKNNAALLIEDIPACIFSTSFIDIDSAGASILRQRSNATGVLELHLEAVGLTPGAQYRIWTGATEQGEGDTTGYHPNESGEVYRMPEQGQIKTVAVRLNPCDNDEPGNTCDRPASCEVP